jgi:DNA-binding CsgD family transcriptional regulator
MTLLGRARERVLLDELVEDVRAGRSRSLVLRGEAGVGKTALLEHLVASAPDLTVVRTVGAEAEMELAFASLHQLCGPLLDRIPRLSVPQRQALEIVFGVSAGGAPDRFLVGLAVLSLLCEVAEERPLLCVVDDAQWLDQASALTLAFVARRLQAEPVGIVFAAREPAGAFQHVSTQEIRGLRDGDARALLASASLFKLEERVRDRIVAETRGNPLALLELPRGLTATQLAGGFGILAADGVAGRIEDSFVRRLGALPEAARRLTLVAAAEPLGDPLLVWRAAQGLGIGPDTADAAAAAGLLTIGDRVTFRHPLVRSAAYRSAAPQDRQAAHRALADVTDRDLDPDRHAWHLAAAAAGPDEGVALALEHSAGRAEARGGLVAAAAFLQRAVALTVDPGRRAERALAAAQASFQAGAFDDARRLVATAEAEARDDHQRARADLLRGHIAFTSGLGREAPPLLLDAARQLVPFDLELARETYLTAWGAAVFAGSTMLAEICRAARALPPSPGPPRPLDLLLDGLAALTTDGRAAATPTLQRAAEALAEMPAQDVLRLGWAARAASAQVWDFERMLEISARQVQLVRDVGALGQLPIHLSQLGLVRAWMGDFADAASLAAEIDAISAATGSPIGPYTALRLQSLQGREAEAAAAISAAIDQAAASGQEMAASYARWSAAVLYNGLARYEEAASAARHALDTLNPFISMWGLPELVEAAARSGDTALAQDALGRLADATRPSATDFGLGIEARCRALLSTATTADGLYREAIERLGRTRLRTELARARLLYGEWLRRDGRRVDARAQLRAAHDQFTAMGMEAFAERALKELLATGEHVHKRTTETRDELTAQEHQIAWLARDGLSNPEIGAQLFLSKRTVEWHLHKVFTKLAIRSRHQLATALPGTREDQGHTGATP